MKLSKDAWTCLDEEQGVWARTYPFNDSGGWSNCFVARIADGELLIISPPVGLKAADFEALEKYGKVVAMVAPNGFHHLGLPEFAARYPEATIYADAAASKRIAAKHKGLSAIQPLDALAVRLPSHVFVFEAPHLKTTDVFARVEVAGGHIWYSNDVLMNSSEPPKSFIFRVMMKLTGTGVGYVVNRLALKFFRPGSEFGAWLRGAMEAHPPKLVVPGHGEVVDEGDVAARTRAALDAAF